MSIFDNFRLRNVFDQIVNNPSAGFNNADLNTNTPYTPDPGVINSSSPTPDASQDPNSLAALNSIFNPSYVDQSALRQHVQAMPKLSDYQPGKARQILGALANIGSGGPAAYSHGAALGFQSNIPGGLKAQEMVNYSPYLRAMDAWQTQEKPLGTLAEIEGRRNVNERIIANDILGRRIQEERARTYAAAEQEKERANQVNEKIRQQRADAYSFKQTHPSWVGKVDSDGKLTFFNPQDPTQSVKTEFDTGKMSDYDKLNLMQANKLADIAASGAEARRTEGVKQTGREQIAETRGWKIFNVPDPTNPGQQKAVKINEITGEVKDINSPAVTKPSAPRSVTTAAGDRPLTPGQQKQDLLNRAQQALIEHPEWGKYITIQGGLVNIKQPSSGFLSSGPDQNTYNEIQKRLGPSTVAPIPSHQNAAQSTAPVVDERVTVYDKATGKVVATIPKADVQRLNKDKYMVK